MKTIMFRQGDVLIQSTEKIPSNKAKVVDDNGRVILAYGEVTGHAHQVHNVGILTPPLTIPGDDRVPAQQLFEEPDGTRLLVVRTPAELQHEEHATIGLPIGNYRVIRQREYSPEAIRNVAD